MHEAVNELFQRIESENDCRVLYACESGSRAWGFASPDSDYDVRFIYAHPVDWHLRLEQCRDTIELMTPDDIDLSGWELRKTLRLFAGCNLALNEWLGSPIVYRVDGEFHRALVDLIPVYFNPKKAMHHYLSMSRIVNDSDLESGNVTIKKLFYSLRCLLACQWIAERESMPPTEFGRLVEAMAPPDLAKHIKELVLLKSSTVESGRPAITGTIINWLIQTREHANLAADGIAVAPDRSWGPLDEVMKRFSLNRE